MEGRGRRREKEGRAGGAWGLDWVEYLGLDLPERSSHSMCGVEILTLDGGWAGGGREEVGELPHTLNLPNATSNMHDQPTRSYALYIRPL